MSSTDSPRFLLLLPPTPSPPTQTALTSVYGDTLSQVLKEVATHSSDSLQAAILEIALAIPHLAGQQNTPRASLFASTQSIVAGVYGLLTRIAAKDGIDVEDQDGVDVRILLVSWSPDLSPTPSSVEDPPYGPVISLRTLAKSGRPWRYAFGVESAEGEAFVQAFVAAKGDGEGVPWGQDTRVTEPARPEPSLSGPDTRPRGQHHHVAIGGTFDHIHIGHKLLLTMTVLSVDAAAPGPAGPERSITIGITGDALLKNKKHAAELESWHDRYLGVMRFVDGILDFSPPGGPQQHVTARDDPGPNGKSRDVHYPHGVVVRCTKIQDPFGPTITEEGISAMVLTAETRAGGRAVNEKRAEKGWAGLELFEVDVLDAEEEGKVREGFESKLSSTAIREKRARKRTGAGGGSSSL